MALNLPSGTRRRQGGPRGWRWGAAVLSGLFQAAAFPPVGAAPVAWVALVPLFLAVSAPAAPGEPPLTFRQRVLLGIAAQAAFFVALLHWILLLPNDEVTVPGLMIPALLFLSGYLSLFFGVAVALPGTLERRGGVPAAASLPVFWTLADILRSTGPLAFPWGSLGYAFAGLPAMIQMTAWTGFWGLTLQVAAVNAFLFAAAGAWAGGRLSAAAARVAGALVLIAVPLAAGAIVLARAPSATSASNSGATAASSARARRFVLVQANTAREVKWKKGYEGIVVGDLLARTRIAAQSDPDLIVWPETAAPVLVLWRPELADSLSRTVREAGCWTLVGSLDARILPDRSVESYNAALLYDPAGVPSQRYHKVRLVPFSERMPFTDRLPWLNALNFGQSDFTPGREPGLFDAGGIRFSVLICFESIFPELARRWTAAGAHYLVNITNDFWFGRSAGPVQHAEMAILRAVENRTPLLRCANSGISFVVDPWGRVSHRTGLFVEAQPVVEVVPGNGGSFYTRHGEWVRWALLASAAAIFLAAWRTSGLLPAGRRRHNRGHDPNLSD